MIVTSIFRVTSAGHSTQDRWDPGGLAHEDNSYATPTERLIMRPAATGRNAAHGFAATSIFSPSATVAAISIRCQVCFPIIHKVIRSSAEGLMATAWFARRANQLAFPFCPVRSRSKKYSAGPVGQI